MSAKLNELNINLAKSFGLDIENLHKFKLEVTPNKAPILIATYGVVVDCNLELIDKTFKLEAIE